MPRGVLSMSQAATRRFGHVCRQPAGDHGDGDGELQGLRRHHHRDRGADDHVGLARLLRQRRFTESYSAKDAGTGLELIPTGVVNDGNNGNNYAVTFVNADTGTITPAPIVISAVTDTKVYDGTTTSSQTPTFQVTGLPANTLFDGDTFTTLSQAFNSKDVLGAGNSTLTVSYVINDGKGGADYSVTTQTATGTVSPAPIVISAVTDTKVYDGTTTSSQTPTFQVTGLPGDTLYDGDTITGLAQAFESKDVHGAGDSTLAVSGGYTINDGDGGADYSVTTQTATGTITPAPIVISAVTGIKVYDGTTASSATPTFQVTGLAANTLYAGDTFTTLSQAFASRNVLGAGNSTLTVSYAIDDGDGGDDYSVTTHTATGTITPAPIVISAVTGTKVYNGTAASSATPTFQVTGLAANTLYAGDTFTTLSQAFASKNVLGAGNSTLTVSYVIDDGDGGDDYSVTTQTATGTITPAPIVISAVSGTKVYDGTTASSATPTFQVTGLAANTLYAGDTFTTLSQAFASNNVLGAGNSTLTVSYAIDDGDGGADYSVTTHTATGTITPAPLTITAGSATVQVGASLPAVSVAYSGFVDGQTAANLITPPVIHDAATSTTTPGVYTITASGASASNYQITYVPGTLTVVSPPATVDGVTLEKIKIGKHKSVEVIVLEFSEALNAADAQSIKSYSLATVPKTKKQKSKTVALSKATYNSTAFTVTLQTKKPLVLSPPLTLTVKASSLLDALGRELDGNDSGQPGSNFVAVLSKKSV